MDKFKKPANATATSTTQTQTAPPQDGLGGESSRQSSANEARPEHGFGGGQGRTVNEQLPKRPNQKRYDMIPREWRENLARSFETMFDLKDKSAAKMGNKLFSGIYNNADEFIVPYKEYLEAILTSREPRWRRNICMRGKPDYLGSSYR